jgi:RNA polymerase subunit RPABC4/transcription elongation factor Spt4
MGVVVHSFFQSDAWYLFRNVTVALLAAFWLASAFWVFRDARRRISDVLLVGIATLLGLLPLIGPVLYLLLRPLETLADAAERELEVRALRQRIRGGNFCSACGAATDASFRFCPVCATEIKPPCVRCESPLDPLWQICPFCGTPTADPPKKVVAAALTLTDVLKPQASESVSQ